MSSSSTELFYFYKDTLYVLIICIKYTAETAESQGGNSLSSVSCYGSLALSAVLHVLRSSATKDLTSLSFAGGRLASIPQKLSAAGKHFLFFITPSKVRKIWF